MGCTRRAAEGTFVVCGWRLTRLADPRVLVVRRDNIGDLVCTTPMFTALRNRYPKSLLAALVNTYNRDVLESHPVVDKVFAYEKAKHRDEKTSLLANYRDRWRLFRELRRWKFDYAILAGPGYQKNSVRLVQLAGVAKVVGFSDGGSSRGIHIPVSYGDGALLHEVEDVFRLLMPLGVLGKPPATLISATGTALDQARRAVDGLRGPGPLVALHISARKPSQRWSAARFSELARLLSGKFGCRVMLLWSPGEQANARHPGDDEKALSVSTLIGESEHVAYPTESVSALMGALALSDLFIGADGGAMHLAAGLGKPVIALFGDSAPSRWRPWGVPSEILQPPSREVSDVSVEDVLRAYGRIIGPGRSY